MLNRSIVLFFVVPRQTCSGLFVKMQTGDMFICERLTQRSSQTKRTETAKTKEIIFQCKSIVPFD